MHQGRPDPGILAANRDPAERLRGRESVMRPVPVAEFVARMKPPEPDRAGQRNAQGEFLQGSLCRQRGRDLLRILGEKSLHNLIPGCGQFVLDRHALKARKIHGINHLSFRIGDEQEWLETMKRQNVDATSWDWPHSRAWYVIDPTGYEIEVAYWRNGVVFDGAVTA